MVCFQEEGPIKCAIQDTIAENGKKSTSTIELRPTKTIESIFAYFATEHEYNPDEIQIIIQNKDGENFVLNDHKDKTLAEVGVKCLPSECNEVIVSHEKKAFDVAEDDLLLGASASPTTGEVPDTSFSKIDNRKVRLKYQGTSSKTNLRPIIVNESSNYVGLVNQAMTCYLNSLLQALYMTPEFRNALYNWEFDGVNEIRSIPYQLQKLFLNLQTSSKSAVETTELTTSFGWQGSDAWHQHDIQELCRVMFDALEQKFKDTRQANLINDLYEGKMLDYVKCLECGTESSREDTFQDIPLPVRPFGSNVAYNSVEEALRAFVQPETLDGNNQYHCEKCKKKCDAHKGLKFTKFPYLLTLHLKRFDFDYSTMHRIKLNDKVVFPGVLNLNSFIPAARTENEGIEERDAVVKSDDCSTTDSGSADDESCQGTDVSSTVNGQDDNCANSDEGIDLSSGNNHHEDAKGPYVYELFSIMIHSGSASGGHYYAYIKDFDKDQWFCFNDQSVTAITEDDIRKTYGGGPQRAYYSGAYSSSTNAYMLMYRQIDKDRNTKAIDIDHFPPHIQALFENMQQKEEEDRVNREKENDMVKLNVYCRHPLTGVLMDTKVSVYNDSTLADAASHAHYRFKLTVPVEDCRIVIYNNKHDCIDCSFPSNDIKFYDITTSKVNMLYTDWFLEIRNPGEEFPTYKSGGINMTVLPINLETGDVDEAVSIRVHPDDTIGTLKQNLCAALNMDRDTIEFGWLHGTEADLLHTRRDDAQLNFDPKRINYKLYVANGEGADTQKIRGRSKLYKSMWVFKHLISVNVVLPDTDVGTLESLSIPSLDLNQNLDKLELANSDRGTNSPSMRASPQPTAYMDASSGDQSNSNSEDSSLSDSDRTLVGDAPAIAILSRSNSPADQHMASPIDVAEDTYNYDVLGHPGEEINWCSEERLMENRPVFFKVTSVVHQSNGQDASYSRCCRVLVDNRMTLESFKKCLEVVVRVPAEYFKVYRQYGKAHENEWSTISERLESINDSERLVIKLGRVLRRDEYSCKIYHLKPDYMDPNVFLFEHIVAKGQNVSTVKKEILLKAKKQHMIEIPYSKARLREKIWRRPRKVYLDDQIFGSDIFISRGDTDMYIQELVEPETVDSNTQLTLFLRQWCPSSIELKPFEEVNLESTKIEELKQKIAGISGIPLENVDIAHVKATFPSDVHLLDIEDDKILDWNPNVTLLEHWPLNANEDGNVFLYRDNREKMKELTEEERKELKIKEDTRLGRLNTKYYSPGRERALKIYLDTSPCKTEDNCID